MPNWYYYDDNLQKKGPINGTQLKILAGNGRIRPETIMETESGQQGQAGQIAGLTFPPPQKRFDAVRKKSGTAKIGKIIGGIAILVLCGVAVWTIFGGKHQEIPEQANQEEQKDEVPEQDNGEPEQKGLEPESEYVDLIIIPRGEVPIGAAPRTHSVHFAAFSPNGKRVLTVGADDDTGRGTARMWDAATGKVLNTFKMDTYSPAFSPDGKRLLAVSDGTAQIWDAATGKVLQTFKAPVVSAVFSPDGKRVLTVTAATTTDADGDSFCTGVQVWDAATGKVLKTFETLVTSAVFSPDGKRLLIAGDPRRSHESVEGVTIWDIAQGKKLWVANVYATSAVFSPDGKLVLTKGEGGGGFSGVARTWDTATAKELRQFGDADSAVFSPDGKLVLTVGNQGTAQIWDTATGRKLQRFDKARSAAFSPDSKLILTVGNQGTAQIWDIATGKELLQRFGKTRSAVFSPDGKWVLAVQGYEEKGYGENDAIEGTKVQLPTPDGGTQEHKIFPVARIWNLAKISLAAKEGAKPQERQQDQPEREGRGSPRTGEVQVQKTAEQQGQAGGRSTRGTRERENEGYRPAGARRDTRGTRGE